MSIRRTLTGMMNEALESVRPPLQGEAYRVEPLRRPTPPPEPTPTDEQRPARRPATPAVPPPRRSREVRRAEVLAALSTRAGVRQALVLQEILGPPKAMRGLDDD